MFPSHTLLESKQQQLYDQNPISKSDPFFSTSPFPFFDEHELLTPFIFPHSPPSDHHQITPPEADHHHQISSCHVANPRRRNPGPVPPKKRTGKKDRHSKICTAQGVRDRRMRLSLQVARKFFDLQDMLGYDKASKTIEWLFCKSNKAIKELAKDSANPNISDAKTESLISECEEDISGIEENSNNNDVKKGAKVPKKKARAKANSRESREKARARARSRTREKMMRKLSHQEERVCAFDYSPDVGTIERLLGNSSCSDLCTSVSFMGNWDLQMNNDRFVTNQGNFTSDFPFFQPHD